jgi:hypothetical protein
LGERGVEFRSLQESIGTTTPGGRLVFHVFAALAEFERDLIRERTHAGLAAARARGRRGGRPSVMTADKVAAARQMSTVDDAETRTGTPPVWHQSLDALADRLAGRPSTPPHETESTELIEKYRNAFASCRPGRAG